MPHISLSNTGQTPFERLIGHTPDVLTQWGELEKVFFQDQTFDAYFLEQIRRTLAYENCCEYCMAKAGGPDTNTNDARLAAAKRFANRFAIDHLSINESEINLMRDYFTDQEIALLISFCAFISASQRIGAALGLKAVANSA